MRKVIAAPPRSAPLTGQWEKVSQPHCEVASAGRELLTSTGGQRALTKLDLKVKVKIAQSCLTLCDPMDYRVHGILQARILEWVAFPFSSGYSRPRNQTGVSCTTGGFLTS